MSFYLHILTSELSKTYLTLLRTKELHAFITKTHLACDPFYATRIVRLYSINSRLNYARHVFDKTPNRTVYLWNSIIRAYAKAHKFGNALSLFFTMFGTETLPDSFTYSCIIRACAENFHRERLKLVHGRVLVSGFGLDPICCSALVTAYSNLDLIEDASKVFDVMPHPDLVMWNSIISGFGYRGFWNQGLLLFSRMRNLGEHPDGYTVVGVASGIAEPSLLSTGKGIHGFCLKCSLDSNEHVASALVSMYSRCNCMDSAYLVFISLIQPDLVTWSALITGYSQSGDFWKALFFFQKLNMQGKKPDAILIASILAAAAQSANIRPGIEIHGYALRQGIDSDEMVSSSLIDIYSKCGYLSLGIRVFHIMQRKGIVAYNSMIWGMGLHGLASKALETFEEMLDIGLMPNESTFSALLCACCHAGLNSVGKAIFKRMRDEFGIKYRTEHYVYIVKLLGMSGELEEAYDLVLSLPEPVDSGVWGALLSCCDACGNLELAEIVAQKLLENNPDKMAYRVMLSNIYAGEGRWDDVKKLRDTMTEKERGKLPGLSWI
ncbi:putative pentatricopeptide repeat-containing protein, partial [Cucurbita argyrosperma subsp. sororia]